MPANRLLGNQRRVPSTGPGATSWHSGQRHGIPPAGGDENSPGLDSGSEATTHFGQRNVLVAPGPSPPFRVGRGVRCSPRRQPSTSVCGRRVQVLLHHRPAASAADDRRVGGALVVERGSSCHRGPAYGGPPRAAALDRIGTLTSAPDERTILPTQGRPNASPKGRAASNKRGCRATGSTLSGGTVTTLDSFPAGAPQRSAGEFASSSEARLSVLSARRGRPDDHYRRSDSDAGSTPRQRPNQILRTWLACRPF